MKVLLVQSYLGGNEPLVFPIGLSCIKSALGGHDVRVFDTNVSPRPFDELKEMIAGLGPDAIGISLRNIDSTNKRKVVFYYDYLKKLIRSVKGSSGAKIIVGGSGFSMFAREIMDDEPGIDFGIYLEGEAAFPELLKNLDAPEKVKFVYYRKNGKVIFTGIGRQVDFNSMDFPDRGAVGLDNYRRIPDAVGVESKRGCVFNCIYCIYGFLNGKRLRLRAPERVADEIEAMVKGSGIERFTFVDSVFNFPQDHAENICRELIRRKIKAGWSAWFNEKGLTRGFVEMVRDAGCRNIILSPDGFSDEILDRLGKNIKKEDILRSYEVLKGIGGLEVSYNFFKNPPGQSLQTFMSLAGFCFKAKMEMGRRVHFEFNSMRIEPHTKLHDIALTEGLVSSGENLLYPKYYTNRETRHIEGAFNMMLRMRGK
ncbi:MAG: cobalamin B12-binding domain-containing protein [Deltaproteobacteria bacterium]|nr:cobalamin B12-binding domain-containing protein [Deltaproteobacteria bacterium]